MKSIDSADYDTFEEWWEEVKAYADEHRLSYTHCEEEFIIEGVFYPVGLLYEKDYAFDFEERE